MDEWMLEQMELFPWVCGRKIALILHIRDILELILYV